MSVTACNTVSFSGRYRHSASRRWPPRHGLDVVWVASVLFLPLGQHSRYGMDGAPVTCSPVTPQNTWFTRSLACALCMRISFCAGSRAPQDGYIGSLVRRTEERYTGHWPRELGGHRWYKIRLRLRIESERGGGLKSNMVALMSHCRFQSIVVLAVLKCGLGTGTVGIAIGIRSRIGAQSRYGSRYVQILSLEQLAML